MTAVAASFSIAGDTNFPCFIERWPKQTIITAITWTELANGGYIGLDRTINGGLQEMNHETQVTFMGDHDYISSLQTKLENDCREGCTLVNNQSYVFCPLVDRESIDVTIEPVEAKQFSFAVGPSGMYEMDAKITGVNFNYVTGVGASLLGLRLANKYTAGKNYNELSRFSYTQVPSYMNPLNDAGTFKATFTQMTSEILPILQFIMIDQRALPFDFPTDQCGLFPFGPTQPEGPLCNITAFTLQQTDVDWWTIEIQFSQYFA